MPSVLNILAIALHHWRFHQAHNQRPETAVPLVLNCLTITHFASAVG